MKRIGIFVFSFFVFLASVSAKGINFEIVQNNGTKEEVFAISNIFEQALSDFFFESGHIVSNSPVFILTDEEASNADLKKVLVDTMLGSMDVLVRLQVNYIENNANNADAVLLESVKDVSWKNYNPKNGKMISGGSESVGKIDSTNNNESGVYNFASFVASKISSTLKSSK